MTLRKMSDKEKEVLRKHFAEKPHNKSDTAKMRMAVLRSQNPVDTPAKVKKLHTQVFGK